MVKDSILLFLFMFLFLKLWFTPFKAGKPLQGIELQEKEAQKY